MAKGKAKLSFITTREDLKPEIECNSIPQVVLHFNYVERWGRSTEVKDAIPEDATNVIEFFNSMKKLSDTGFQTKKFKEIWDKYNMPDITDYEVIIE